MQIIPYTSIAHLFVSCLLFIPRYPHFFFFKCSTDNHHNQFTDLPQCAKILHYSQSVIHLFGLSHTILTYRPNGRKALKNRQKTFKTVVFCRNITGITHLRHPLTGLSMILHHTFLCHFIVGHLNLSYTGKMVKIPSIIIIHAVPDPVKNNAYIRISLHTRHQVQLIT